MTDLGSDDLDGFEEHRSGIFRMSLSLGPSTVLLMVGLGRVTLKKVFIVYSIAYTNSITYVSLELHFKTQTRNNQDGMCWSAVPS